jgi:enoyl-[acyl-carrier protein] reductase II
MLRTRLCELLGIAHPIICAPMGWITGPELTAAVSRAGGLGILGAGANSPELLRQKIRRVRELTDRPFGINLILSRPA